MVAIHGTMIEQAAPQVPRAPRTITTLRVARLLRSGCADTPCLIRNVSVTGMLVETRAALVRDMPVSIELRGGTHVHGRVAWQDSGRAGIATDAPIDLDHFLSEAANEIGVPRAPRFDVACPVRLSSYGRATLGTIENLSQTGARLLLPEPVSPNIPYRITLPGLPARHCAVRWCDGEEVGVRFVEPIAFGDLSRWLYANGFAA